MNPEWIIQIMRRDLRSLGKQVEAYPDEGDLWKRYPGITNSTGTLAIHIAGNLQHFVGAQLGKSGYLRDREREFTATDVPRDQILAELRAADATLEAAGAKLDAEALAADYPLELGGARPSVGALLVHLAAHLGFHLGQVDYHRRFTTGEGALPGMVSPGELGGR